MPRLNLSNSLDPYVYNMQSATPEHTITVNGDCYIPYDTVLKFGTLLSTAYSDISSGDLVTYIDSNLYRIVKCPEGVRSIGIALNDALAGETVKINSLNGGYNLDNFTLNLNSDKIARLLSQLGYRRINPTSERSFTINNTKKISENWEVYTIEEYSSLYKIGSDINLCIIDNNINYVITSTGEKFSIDYIRNNALHLIDIDDDIKMGLDELTKTPWGYDGVTMSTEFTGTGLAGYLDNTLVVGPNMYSHIMRLTHE